MKEVVWTQQEVEQLMQAIKDSFISPIVHEEFVALMEQMHGIKLK